MLCGITFTMITIRTSIEIPSTMESIAFFLPISSSVSIYFCCSYQAAPSAAISSIKSVIGSPFDWNSQALNGMPLAACGQIPNV